MDWATLLLGLFGGGVLGTIVTVFFKWLEHRGTTRVAAAKVEVDAAKVVVEERQVDGSVAEQVARAFGGLVRELRERIDDLEADHRECRAELARVRTDTDDQILSLKQEIADLHLEVRRLRGGHSGL